MDLEAVASVTASASDTLAVLADLSTYPSWLGVVGSASPVEPHDRDAGPAWAVDLVGRVGPLVRRKRVRMVRTALDDGAGTVVFERVEHDGRSHNAWILTGSAAPGPLPGDGTLVRVGIHYGGGRGLPGADRLLRQEVRNAGKRLEAHLRDRF